MPRLTFLLSACLCVLLAACGGATAKATPTYSVPPFSGTLTGTITAHSCAGVGGVLVEVRNENDTIIATGNTVGRDTNLVGDCEATFAVEHLPRAKFYQLQIGSHHGPIYSFSELLSSGWHVDMTLP